MNRANKIKAEDGSLMQSYIADKLLSNKNKKDDLIKVYSPLLGIKLKTDQKSLCKRCYAYYCNCDGKLLQNYKNKNLRIKKFHVNKIKFKDNIFILYVEDKEKNFKKLYCKYLIFACGPIVSAILLNTIQPIKEKLQLNHNGVFTFPFISYYKIKKYPLALSNLNLEIYAKSKKINSRFPDAYTNIFPLKPQLIIKYPLLKIIPNFILNRIYIAVTFMDSSYVESKFCLKEKKIYGKYQKKFYIKSYIFFIRLIVFLFRNSFSIPITLPIFSKPGSDIHYASTLKNITFKKNISESIFFADSSQIDSVIAMNSTVYNLSLLKTKLRNWLKNK